MTECDKYIEQISCLIDGELEPGQEAELRAHLAACEDCRRVYNAFMAISDEDELVPAPEGLADGVMYLIEKQQKGSKPRLFVFGRFTAIAACLALLIYGGAHYGLFDFGKSSAPESADTESYTLAAPNAGFQQQDAATGTESFLLTDEDRLLPTGDAGATLTSGEDSCDKGANKYCMSGAGMTDPTIRSIHSELDTKLRLGETEIYEGEKATSKRFLIVSPTEADALLEIFDCALLSEGAALAEKPNYTIFFDDGSRLLVWFVQNEIICRMPDNTLYVARGTPNSFSDYIEQALSSK